jgi:NTP pyrophosphatase (non-canonical NTP hydrolase)
MELNKKQKEIHELVSKYGGYWSPLSMLARLVEEVGELAREFNHVYGEKKRKPEEKIKSIEGEIGDILITLFCISNSLNINLDDVYKEVTNKIKKRDKDRTKSK